jgi:BolA protein
MNTTELMLQRLSVLEPASIDIRDDSARHAGHEGARGGGGHYELVLVTSRFRGVTLRERHRMVYDALRPLLQSSIHALSIKAYAPEEI